MQFNPIIRGAKREHNSEQELIEVIDAGCLCHIAFNSEGKSCILPTAYGRSGFSLYLHGSSKNHLFSELIKGQQISIAITHLDGLVLAKSLFHSSMNYRSAVLFGKAVQVMDEQEKMEGLKLICDQIIKGRSEEVLLGLPKEINATMVLRFDCESASVKIRTGGPAGDESISNSIWSGHIPLKLKAETPITDTKFSELAELSPSVKNYLTLNQ